MSPPIRHPLLLARLQQMGDQVAQASPFKVRPLLQLLSEVPRGGEGDPLRSATEQIHSRSRG